MKKPMIPSSRPCDVSYRIQRYNALLEAPAKKSRRSPLLDG